MEQETSWIVDEGVVEPELPLLRREKVNKYGSVPGLDGEELADPDELERQVYMEEFGPVLQLPVRGRWSGIRPDVDESGGVDWGAFGTVDFERTMPRRDKSAYKAYRLREQLRDTLILYSIVKGHVPETPRRAILKSLESDVIEFDHIADPEMRGIARLYLKARRLQREIASLKEVRARRAKAQHARLFGSEPEPLPRRA